MSRERTVSAGGAGGRDHREPWADADQGCLRADGAAREENEILQQVLGVTQIYFSYIYDAAEYQSIYTKG